MLNSYYWTNRRGEAGDASGVPFLSKNDLKKFEGKKGSIMQMEDNSEFMVAPSAIVSEEEKHYIKKKIDQNQHDEKLVSAYKTRLVLNELSNFGQAVDQKFFSEFVSFLLGKTPFGSEEYRRILETPYGAGAALYRDNTVNPKDSLVGWHVDYEPPAGRHDEHGEEIRKFLNTFLDNHFDTAKYLIHLKAEGPKTLQDHWMYFKYIVKGETGNFGQRLIPEVFYDVFDWQKRYTITNPNNSANSADFNLTEDTEPSTIKDSVHSHDTNYPQNGLKIFLYGETRKKDKNGYIKIANDYYDGRGFQVNENAFRNYATLMGLEPEPQNINVPENEREIVLSEFGAYDYKLKNLTMEFLAENNYNSWRKK